jgi:polysaccharide biosynthesis protein PslH
LKVAVLLSRFPYPLERGDKLRAYYQIKYLSKFHDIYLLAASDTKIEGHWIQELKPFCKEIIIDDISLFNKIAGVGYALLNGWPLQTGIVYKKTFKNRIEKFIKKHQIEVVYCQLIRMAPYCQSLSLPKVLDYMDAFGEGMMRRSKLVPFPEDTIYTFESNRVRKFEQDCLRQFTACTIISDNDKKALSVDNSDKVKVISNGIDMDKFRPDLSIEKKYDVGFIGNLGYLPNIEAAEYLVNQVASAYQKKHHHTLKILISGARPDERIIKLASTAIEVQGWIENIALAYQSISVLCAPIFSGTGQQNKILESMACGTPVLCNTELNISIGAINGHSIITTANLEEMVDQLYNLLNDPDLQKNISKAACQFVAQNYSWDNVTQNLNNVLKNAVLN